MTSCNIINWDMWNIIFSYADGLTKQMMSNMSVDFYLPITEHYTKLKLRNLEPKNTWSFKNLSEFIANYRGKIVGLDLSKFSKPLEITDDLIMQIFEKHTNLTSLDLSTTKVAFESMAITNPQYNLKILKLGNCESFGVNGFKKLPILFPQLQALDLSYDQHYSETKNNLIDNEALPSLKGFEQLTYFNFQGRDVDENLVLEYLSQCRNTLRQLFLHNNGISKGTALCKFLNICENLQVLSYQPFFSNSDNKIIERLVADNSSLKYINHSYFPLNNPKIIDIILKKHLFYLAIRITRNIDVREFFTTLHKNSPCLKYLKINWIQLVQLEDADDEVVFQTVKYLTLSPKNASSEGLRKCLEKFPKTTHLQIRKLSLDEKPLKLPHNSNLEHLDLSLSQPELTEAEIKEIVEAYPSLKHLNLCDTTISSDSLRLIAERCTSLTYINLSSITLDFNSLCELIEKFTQLKSIKLPKQVYSESELQELGKKFSLKSIFL